MNISSKSIIHYTNTIEKLQSILLEGFKLKYCTENFHSKKTKGSFAAHPMVCFSDIPLSSTFSENWSYGNYAIGLSKNWATKMGINPVLYIDEKSSIAESLGTLLENRRTSTNELTSNQRLNIMKLKCFTKNYQGYNSKLEIDDYVFYNEREWRFVPNKDFIEDNLISINQTQYLEKPQYYNVKISKYKLEFQPSDISYLILKKTKEIPTLIKYLKEEYRQKNSINENEFEILVTKITSVERIKNDF